MLLPVHLLHLVEMGMLQGQLWSLDELADDCAADGQYEFLLCATPLPLTRSVGGPVAPGCQRTMSVVTYCPSPDMAPRA